MATCALPASPDTDPRDAPLLELLDLLERRDWDNVCATPATHARVAARRPRATNLAGALGWSLPFARGEVDAVAEALLVEAGAMVRADDGLWRATIRVSRLGGHLFLHSAWPTDDAQSVFFGPDSYRFADFLALEMPNCPHPPAIVADIGTGSGVGAMVAGDRCPRTRLVATDINPHALRLARLNFAHAGRAVELVETSGLDAVPDPIEVAILNPPYIADPDGRAYRDGGGMLGGALGLRLSVEAARRLAPGGRVILYTGSAIVDGHDPFRAALETAMAAEGCELAYRELDPDVFGEELDQPAYATADRIAAVGAVAVKQG